MTSLLYDRLLFVSAERISPISELRIAERLAPKSALLLYTLRGYVDARCDYDRYTLYGGMALLINEHTDLTIMAAEDAEFCILRFAADFGDEVPFVLREAVDRAACERLLADINRTSHSPDYPEETCDYLLRLLIIELARRDREEADDNELYPKIMKYIEENAASDLTAAGVAQVFEYSPDHLARNFKEYYGRGLKSAIDAVKLKYIRERLTDESLTNAELAAECGFRSYKSLAEFFKYNTGMAIAAYRKTKRMEKKRQ